MEMTRGSGVLLHISSLPGRYGIGTLGGPAREFVDFLAEAGQSYWQFLPLGPVSKVASYSPYMSFSAFAGNRFYIDPDQLAAEGLVSPAELAAAPVFSDYQVDFARVEEFFEPILVQAFRAFIADGPSEDYADFCERESWLDDYAFFMALKESNGQLPWYRWPAAIGARHPDTLEAWRRKLADRIDFHRFCQYLFYRQWDELRAYANSRGVAMVGDIPIYVGHDSADVWANPDCFRLDPATLLPTRVAGVPPDYFSATGQRWGNPLFRWRVDGRENRRLYDWWGRRFRAMFRIADICRIDHFRGFESFWEIDFEEATAVNGRWSKGPGRKFFTDMAEHIGDLPIIAEDLGMVTPEVLELRREFGFPGMKVLQFAFDSDEKNPYLPHNYRGIDSVVYTGTHDNDTTLGWFTGDQVGAETREKVRRYLHTDGSEISRDLIRLALASVAAIAIFPMQDVLGFGNDCRMNRPGTSVGNWRWRCAPRFLNRETAAWLKDETEFYNRIAKE
ncbi:MAG: 4-alpha-glucanotransferase [Desulfobulbales bacterium]|nr:4-alpha-glucanotransferase [Desulfobulbales bacterium]